MLRFSWRQRRRFRRSGPHFPCGRKLLVAWCAGSRAEKLAGKSEGEIVASVKESLRELFGRRNYSSLLERVLWHDWQGDPFSCGAYSYVVAQGSGRPAR